MTNHKELTYAQAINAALVDAMMEFDDMILFGEDVALPGGVFGVTKGLHKRFGSRVFDTPISESAILGGAVGAAIVGRRPVVEIMWIDFMLVALDQIVNQAANVRYVSEGRLQAPITVRTQQGYVPGSPAQHAQCLEALLAHIPGLQVCMPSDSQDAYDLLRTSIASNDPTVFIEHRVLYHGKKQPVVLDAPRQGVGGSRIARRGSDVTLVTWGAIKVDVLEACAQLEAEESVSVEVIDAVWLRPFDFRTVLESVARTGRLVVVHEAHTFAGLGAEVIATVAESGVDLKSAPRRIGASDARVPAAPALAARVLPGVQDILEGVRAVMAHEPHSERVEADRRWASQLGRERHAVT